MSDDCEMCAQPVGPHRVVERPTGGEVAYLKRFFWVMDPERLVFCTEACRRKWHGLKRRAKWEAHGAGCACVECLD